MFGDSTSCRSRRLIKLHNGKRANPVLLGIDDLVHRARFLEVLDDYDIVLMEQPK